MKLHKKVQAEWCPCIKMVKNMFQHFCPWQKYFFEPHFIAFNTIQGLAKKISLHAYNFATKEPTLIAIISEEFNTKCLSSTPLLKQKLCSHKFQDDHAVETAVT
jgi:hypothetical protein